ncbi:MAG: dihydroneopterin aldolase [Caulobacteraceae bacterium]|nr:dihydroneopterin aldolase [Caulobacteraceae bacterium]
MYGLFLRDFEITANLGIHDFEQRAPQRVVVNVALALEARHAGDDIATVLDYDFLREEIAGLAARGHIFLQETLCAGVLELCKAKPGVLAARVTTEKPDVYPDTAGVGCRMVWLADGVEPWAALLALGGG